MVIADGRALSKDVHLWRSLAGLIGEYDLRVSQGGDVRTTRFVLR